MLTSSPTTPQFLSRPTVLPMRHRRRSSRKAAEIGAEVLAAGGDLRRCGGGDHVLTRVAEPWMSGLGGGGAMVPLSYSEKPFRGDRLWHARARHLRVEIIR